MSFLHATNDTLCNINFFIITESYLLHAKNDTHFCKNHHTDISKRYLPIVKKISTNCKKDIYQL